jgi:hypothetical protein
MVDGHLVVEQSHELQVLAKELENLMCLLSNKICGPQHHC